MTEEVGMGEFLAARGGPFYELQRRLGLLHENALRVGSRAAVFVALAWGAPLALSLLSGDAFGPAAGRPFLLDPVIWARYFVAIGLFVLMEGMVEERLRVYLRQFVRAPLLAPKAFDAAARSVTRALKRRDAPVAEIVCLIIAVVATVAATLNVLDAQTSSWAVQVSPGGNSLTPVGWWCAVISGPMFWFLLLRWLWRQFVWARLLRDLAGLELRLVATHPDGHGGLGFLVQYPNTFSAFVFAMSCVVGAVIAQRLIESDLALSTYGAVMGAWLLIVLALFAYPLLAFYKPLAGLKERTLLLLSAQATRQRRAAERELLGSNVYAPDEPETPPGDKIPDPAKEFESTRKLSPLLFSRSALLPVSAAALIPLIAAGATLLPFKQLLSIAKKLVLL
jgi:hypothetical protein